MDRDGRTELGQKKRKKRILFIISSLYGGGAERVCCVLASEFAKKYNVIVLYRNDKGRAYPLNPRVRTIMMNVKDDGPGHPMQKILRPFYKYGSCRKLKKIFRPDVSISFLFDFNKLNVLSRGNCRIICSERNNPRKRNSRIEFLFTKWFYKKADCVVFQSDLIKNMYSEKIKAHSVVITNPVCVTVKASPNRSHRIVNMGRFVAQKNQAMLLRSFAVFHQQFSDFTLTIYGEGELFEELECLAKELKISDFVEFPGNVEDVHQKISDAEIFVLSSDFEGMSNALLECMSMGIACISTACEGSVDVIKDGVNGLLVPVGDETALTEAMCRLAKDEGLRRRLEKNALKDMEAYTPEKIARQWENVMFS